MLKSGRDIINKQLRTESLNRFPGRLLSLFRGPFRLADTDEL